MSKTSQSMFDSDTHLQLFTPPNKHEGHFDGEFFYPPNKFNFRVDGDEVYSLNIPTERVGTVEKVHDIYLIKDLSGTVLYELRD